MLTIIFGAGASYDSYPTKPSTKWVDSRLDLFRLPLAKDLFDERYGVHAERNIRAQGLFYRLRIAAPNIEQELEKINEEVIEGYTKGATQLLALRYYLKGVLTDAQINWRSGYIHDVSTYHALLSTVDRWQAKTGEKVSLVTFNYDTLLDLACSSVMGMNLTTMKDYFENKTPYQIFKVHGSINWWHKVEKTNGNVLASAPNLFWTNDFATDNESRSSITDTDWVPAIAVPTVTKTSFEFPFLHKEQLTSCLEATNRLLVIGWRGAEKHFLELWKKDESLYPKQLEKIQIVNTSIENGKNIFRRISEGANLTSHDVKFSDQGFSGFVQKGIEAFLA